MSGSTSQAAGNKDRLKPREILIPVATTILGALLGAYGADLASSDDAVGRRAAEGFIDAYYAEVTDAETAPDAWEDKLSPDMQENEPLSDFKDWWANWSDVVIEDGSVEANPDVENGYVARIAPVDVQGQRHSFREVKYQFECTNRAAGRFPGVSCSVEDIRLVDAWQPAAR